MSQYEMSLCEWCQHREDQSHVPLGKYGIKERCAAFRTGIPDDVWYMHKIHKTPLPGDGGIVFKPVRFIPKCYVKLYGLEDYGLEDFKLEDVRVVDGKFVPAP